MWQLISPIFLGWSLGSNDTANVFGTAVTSRMLRFSTAAILFSVFVMLGAWMDGAAGMHTYSKMSKLNVNTAFIVCLSAALSVTTMNLIKLQVSTSQAVVGSLVFIGVQQGSLDTKLLAKIIACWIGTPIGAAIIAIILYFVLGKILNRLHLNIFQYDTFLRTLLILSGIYGAYALGANNVANVTGAFVGTGPGMLNVETACLLGGGAIALGALTNGYRVMETIGKQLVKLNAFTALVAVMAEAITVHLYAMLGVPVSTSQALVGAILGLGLLKGLHTIKMKTLSKLLFAWLGSPNISFALTFVLYNLFIAIGLI